MVQAPSLGTASPGLTASTPGAEGEGLSGRKGLANTVTVWMGGPWGVLVLSTKVLEVFSVPLSLLKVPTTIFRNFANVC